MKNLYNTDLGFIVANERGIPQPTVYEENLFTVQVNKLDDLPKKTFDTIPAMVKAGWVGD